MKKVINPRWRDELYTLFWVVVIAFICYDVYTALVYEPPPPLHPKQVCYHSTGETVKPEFQAEGTLVRVNYIGDTINFNGDDAVGLSKYLYDDELNMTMCEIWIPLPTHVMGDDKMDTVGHELLHCLTGSFHR